MNKDQWTEIPANPDTSKGDVRFGAHSPPEEAKALAKKSGALKDDVRDVARTASETAKDVGKEAKAGASEIGRTAADMAATVKEGAQEAGTEMKRGAKGALQHTKDAAVDIGEAAKEVAGVAKDTAAGAGEAVKDAVAVVKEDASELMKAAASGTQEIAREIAPAMRRAGRAAGTFVAGNAVPLSLLGFGAGWIMMKGRRRSTVRPERAQLGSAKTAFSEPSGTIAGEIEKAGEAVAGEIEKASEAVAGEIEKVRSKAGEFVHAAGTRAREVAHETRERATHLKDQTVHQLEGARDAVSREAHKLGKEARIQYVHAKDVTTDFAHHNPLLLIALSLGAGMGTSYLFPSTRSEQRLMGGRRDRLVGEARETVSRIGQIAHKAATEVRHPN
jgi:ElaB/YqjD/DUF883 family membrane-anchored ribosome-binding protein